ncbi:MAG TPA: deoxynucleoside kinase [Spirochaetia bacterium]|nr:deoxynucleoside kinase [Spirochaetia bacterium]
MSQGGERVIVIEGQIGVGKTTMGELLERELGLTLFRELQHPETHTLLDRFYADQKRWAFTLQIHFLNERFRMIKEIRRSGGGALDRSIYGDRIFAEVLHEDRAMSHEEFMTYETLLANMLEHVQPPDLLVYLDCTVDTALRRIRKRNRGLESDIPRDYLERLNAHYLAWYEHYDLSPKLLIDTDATPLDDADGLRAIIDRIRAVLKEGRYGPTIR